jgi:quercetin dioxygenase-like cupin family protein
MFTVLDVASLQGRRKPISRAIGAHAVKLNRFDSQPAQEGFAHDERESGQEEIYIPIAGAGVLWVGGEEIPLAPGRFVLVSADETRQVVAGADGLTYLVAGAAPGQMIDSTPP